MQRLLELDEDTTRRLSIAERPGPLRTLAVVFARSGDSWFWLLGLSVVWLLGSDFWKQRALILVVAILITAVIVLGIKFTVRRARPEGEWGKVYRSTDPHSFPSGHAARAAMLAIMTLGLGPMWLGLLLVIWAPLVILSRVAMGVHYLSDVLAGAFLGIVMGVILLNLLPALL
jgi:membrane-associated phospholipid phosphatase